MPDSAARFGRLLRSIAGQERALQGEVERSLLACRQVEGELQAAQARRPLAEAGTAAALCHRDRYAALVERQCQELQQALREARGRVATDRLRWRRVAQTRRTLERLIGRLAEGRRARQQRQKQALADEHAQRYAPE
ncbi:hypothetical protein LLH23_12625 [bacterium]|nr:hypothetical protein [bacterium]